MALRVRAALFDQGGTLLESPPDIELWSEPVMRRIRAAFGNPTWASSLYRELGLIDAYATEGHDAYRQDTSRHIAKVLLGLGVEMHTADVERLRNFDAPYVQELAQSFAVDKLSGNEIN